MRNLFFLFLIAFLPQWALGQNVRKFSNDFLSIGVGARALGLSHAVVASNADLTSSYWNPAGLARLNGRKEAAAQHASYFASIANYDYLGYSQGIDSNTQVAVSLIRFGVDDILNTTQLIDQQGNVDYNRISTFNAADYALILSLAKANIQPDLNLGLSAKIIYRHIGPFASAIGFGFDIGAQYKRGPWMLGATAYDITSTFNAWQVNTNDLDSIFQATGNVSPEEGLEITLPSLSLGIARAFILNPSLSLLTEFNLKNFFDGPRQSIVRAGAVSFYPQLGTELNFKNWAFLRLGANAFQKSAFDGEVSFQPNFGVGIAYKRFTLDYAFTNIGNQSTALYSNIFSLKFELPTS